MDEYRMSLWREAKWLLAAKMIGWALYLTKNEIGVDGLRAFSALGIAIKNDPRYDVIKMRLARKE